MILIILNVVSNILNIIGIILSILFVLSLCVIIVFVIMYIFGVFKPYLYEYSCYTVVNSNIVEHKLQVKAYSQQEADDKIQKYILDNQIEVIKLLEYVNFNQKRHNGK